MYASSSLKEVASVTAHGGCLLCTRGVPLLHTGDAVTAHVYPEKRILSLYSLEYDGSVIVHVDCWKIMIS